jgi:tetratricopeptide (TPR) repeat protein
MTTEIEIQDFYPMMSRAQALIEIERWGEAVKILNKGLAVYPENHWILCSLSLSHLNMGARELALEFADRAVGAEPDQEWGHRLRSIILLRQKKPEEALRAAREAVRIAPELSMTLYNLSQTLIANKQVDEARAAAEKLRQVDPESELAHKALGHVALEQRRWAEAEEHFTTALRINPNNYEAMNNLGVALLNQGREDEATRRFHQAAAINPMGEVARSNLKVSIKKFLPLTGAGLFFIFKALALKGSFFFGWTAIQVTRFFFRGDESFSWSVFFAGLFALAFTIFYLIMLFSGVRLFRSSPYEHLPQGLQNYIHLERRRARRGFVWRAIGGASLVVLIWWVTLWRGDPAGEFTPHGVAGWLCFITLCVTMAVSGALLLMERRRAASSI